MKFQMKKSFKNITKKHLFKYIVIFSPKKMKIFICFLKIFFLFLLKTLIVGTRSNRLSSNGSSNEYPKSMF